MKGLVKILWNNPTAFAGALQAGNTVAAYEHALPVWASALIAGLIAGANYAVVKPARPRRR